MIPVNEKTYDDLKMENDELRRILRECLSSLQNGSGCGPNVSISFLASIPTEIKQEVSLLKSKLRDSLEVIRCEEQGVKLIGWDKYERLLDIIRSHEWVTDGREGIAYCLHCQQPYYKGHRMDCELFGELGIARVNQ